MSFANAEPPTPARSLIAETRRSCRDARRAAGISVDDAAIDAFLLDVLPAAPSDEQISVWRTTGLRLPLAYDTVHDEINVVSVLCFLNSLSGYRRAFHAALGQGAHKVIVQIVMALYIGGSTGQGTPLSAETLASMTPMGLLTLLNLSTHDEKPHDGMPAVVIGKRRRDEVYDAFETLCIAANDTGKRLVAMKCRDLGTLVEQLLREAAKEGKTDEERASLFVHRISTALPAFNDAHRLQDGSVVYMYKRAFLLLSWTHAAFSKRSDTAKMPPIPSPAVLPAFVDNVLPSLLVHFKVLDLSDAKGSVLREWGKSATSARQADSAETKEGDIVDGPTLERDTAYIVRAAAVDAIRLMSERAQVLAVERDRPWLKHVDESLLDAWLWTQAKRADLTSVPRMTEKKTFQY